MENMSKYECGPSLVDVGQNSSWKESLLRMLMKTEWGKQEDEHVKWKK